jgi:hypothetical protein
MSSKSTIGLLSALDIGARIVGAWLITLIGLLVAIKFEQQPHNMWGWGLVLLAMYTAPPIALSALLAVTFAAQMNRRPLLWTAVALAVSTTFGWAFVHEVGFYTLIGTVPTAAMVLCSLRFWPLKIDKNAN